ncbi:hypothetical protein [Chryseobacterium foetidum]|uniref:hypothetical protein n=1 Tax=Chryseobacterium foetidum TaxID=2951057 RepID=UPI0021C57BF9|nr:hypothetical protein [Chryseobacterium foetidum]
MKNLIFYLSLSLLTVSCANFKNIESAKTVIGKNVVDNIDGTYKNLPSSTSGFYVRALTDVFDRNTNMFSWKEKYVGEHIKVKLQMVNNKRLNVIISKDKEVLFNKNLRVKLKNDGYLYLKEKRLMIDGIPLVFGGWNVQKSRLRVDENNNLTIQSNYFFCNGFAVVMSDWKTLHYDLTFEKQKP